MPLRDHFRPPLADRRRWDAFHGSWPCLILMGLDRRLPQRYVAEPRIHLGSSLESDVPTFDEDDAGFPTPPRPTLAVATDLPDMDAYEVRVYDTIYGRQLVAAVEVVSPSNKDRPEHRRAFVAKCATLLRDSVSVTIVDLVRQLPENKLVSTRDSGFVPSDVSQTGCGWMRTSYLGRLSWRWSRHSMASKASLAIRTPFA